MKTKLPFAILFALIVFDLPAQIVLTAADFPVIGDQAILRSINGTSTSPGPSGAGQTWNFTSLSGGYLDTLFYLDPASTPAAASFPTSDICEKHGDNNYEFFDNTATGMRLTGFDDNGEVIVLNTQGYTFPLLAYGNSIAHQFRAKFNVVSANTYDATYLEHNSMADGWGTLSTPAGTVNVLRIFTTEMRYDSSYVSGVGTQTGTAVGYYYKWYAKGLGWPVLEISRGAIGEPDYEKTMYATDLSGVTGISEQELENIEVKVYPNPFTASFTLQSDRTLSSATLQIFDMTGQLVYEMNQVSGNSIAVSTGGLAAGIYGYHLYTKDGERLATGRLVRE